MADISPLKDAIDKFREAFNNVEEAFAAFHGEHSNAQPGSGPVEGEVVTPDQQAPGDAPAPAVPADDLGAIPGSLPGSDGPDGDQNPPVESVEPVDPQPTEVEGPEITDQPEGDPAQAAGGAPDPADGSPPIAPPADDLGALPDAVPGATGPDGEVPPADAPQQ